MKELTIVIPAYNEANNIRSGVDAILNQLTTDGVDAILILVDDGSSDNTWLELSAMAKENPSVSAVRLSRNFGKEAAIFAGVSLVKTEYCLIMDSDLQHPPRYVKEFMRKIKETGADIIDGVKESRGKESLKYKLSAKSFYKMLKSVSGIELENSSDFKLLNRKVMDAIADFKEGSVFFRGLISWSGFRKEELPFSVDERIGGTSKFSTRKLIKFALNSLLSYTSKPIYITLFFGMIFLGASVILGVQTLYNYFRGSAVSGFSTVILLLLIIGSLILISLGIIGAYIARIYDEVKKRPRYFISEKSGKIFEEDDKL